jgi:hypothetical protein
MGNDDSREFQEAEISKVLQYRLLKWAFRSRLGQICFGMVIVCSLAFVVWVSLPQDIQKDLLRSIFHKEVPLDSKANLTVQKESREKTLSFKGKEEVKTEMVSATQGWRIIQDSIAVKNIQGESAESATVAAKSDTNFTVQVRLDSSIKRLQKQGGWAMVRVKWDEARIR